MAGLGDVHFHDLRHTFASHLIQNTNGDLKAVQDLIGQRYSHDYALRALVARISPAGHSNARPDIRQPWGISGPTDALGDTQSPTAEVAPY